MDDHDDGASAFSIRIKVPTFVTVKLFKKCLPAMVLLVSLSSILVFQSHASNRYNAGGFFFLSASSNESTQIGSNTSLTKNENIPVFYTLFVDQNANETEVKRVEAIVFEQLANLKPIHHPVFIHSIGKTLPIPNTTLLHHHESANEEVTLLSLWRYCQNNTHSKVVYLHAKGSFHPSRQNERLRQFLTAGALSDECASLPQSCNVCSSRFSPFPHPHTPGNMWLAQCDYVSKLINPMKIEDRMLEVPNIINRPKNLHDSVFGIGRFASEHYIHSHWRVQPCDLYPQKTYIHGYNGIPANPEEFHFELEMAPRFTFQTYKKFDYKGNITNLAHRLDEYQILYNETPDHSFWGMRMPEWQSEARNLHLDHILFHPLIEPLGTHEGLDDA
jgi:hypothetical protein